ncbi:unnamed protein product [Closterium sp. NIES-64]|nr:unnamed protein product [Closterium sp. NIES-64]
MPSLILQPETSALGKSRAAHGASRCSRCSLAPLFPHSSRSASLATPAMALHDDVANHPPVPDDVASRPRVLVLGSPSVGKTTLAHRLTGAHPHDYSSTSSNTAAGECFSWQVDTKYYTAAVAVWTARLSSVLPCSTTGPASPLVRGVEALLLVFDLSNPASFAAVQRWAERADLSRFEIRLCVGNKADRVRRGGSAGERSRRGRQRGGGRDGEEQSDFDGAMLLGAGRGDGEEAGEGEGEKAEAGESVDAGEVEREWSSEGAGEGGRGQEGEVRRRQCEEWCADNGIEYVEACAAHEEIDAGEWGVGLSEYVEACAASKAMGAGENLCNGCRLGADSVMHAVQRMHSALNHLACTAPSTTLHAQRPQPPCMHSALNHLACTCALNHLACTCALNHLACTAPSTTLHAQRPQPPCMHSALNHLACTCALNHLACTCALNHLACTCALNHLACTCALNHLACTCALNHLACTCALNHLACTCALNHLACTCALNHLACTCALNHLACTCALNHLACTCALNHLACTCALNHLACACGRGLALKARAMHPMHALGTDGEMQGIQRIRTALGAHMWPGLALKAPGGARGAPMQGLSQLMGLAGSHASHTHEGQPDSPHSSSASEESTDSDSDSDPASLDPTHFPYHRLDDAPDPALPHSPPAHPSLVSAPCAASSASNGSVPAGEVGSAAGAGVSGETAGVAGEATGKDEERKEKEEGSEADEDFGPDRTDSDTREGVHLHPFDHGDADEARADMDGMERLFLQVASVRSSLQNAPDAVRRDTAARLAMQIAQMLGGDDDDAWGRQASGPAQGEGGEGEGGAMGGSEGKGGEGGRGRVVCVTCGARREQLYRVHSPGSIEVLKCVSAALLAPIPHAAALHALVPPCPLVPYITSGECGAAADPYVECDPLLVLLDVLLLKPQAHRHVVHNLVLASPTPHARPLCLATALILLCHATLLVFRAAHGITVDPAHLLSLPIIAQGVAVSLLSKLLFLALVFFSLPAARHLLSWLPAIGPPQAASSQKKPHSVPFPVVFYSLLLSSPPECLALPLLIWKYEWGMLFLSVQVLLFVSHIASLQAVSFIPWPAAAASIACGHMAIHAFEARACAMLAQSYWMAGRAGRDKGALRAMMREMAQKTEKRIDSPLVRYNELGQAVCRVCTTVIKSESLWAAHLVSKQHKESAERLKQRAKAAAPPATAGATSAAPRPTAAATPAAPGGGRPAAASAAGALPSDFFDSASAAKRPRHDMPSATSTIAASVPANPPAAAHPAATALPVRQSSGPSGSVPATSAALAARATAPASAASAAPPSTTSLPADFFDAPAPAAAAPAAPSAPAAAAPSSPAAPAAPASASALPPDFFDGPSTATAAAAAASPAPAAAKGGKGGGVAGKGAVGREGGVGQGVLPEGFFDSKEADHRARGVEYKKPDAE